jgi:hypothetical protein
MKENDNNIIEIDLQNKVNKAENAEIKEMKEDEGKELNIKYCPTNANVADLLTKPLTKANIHKIRKTIKSIVGQQECVGEKHNYGTSFGTSTGTAIGSGCGCWSKIIFK